MRDQQTEALAGQNTLIWTTNGTVTFLKLKMSNLLPKQPEIHFFSNHLKNLWTSCYSSDQIYGKSSTLGHAVVIITCLAFIHLLFGL